MEVVVVITVRYLFLFSFLLWIYFATIFQAFGVGFMLVRFLLQVETVVVETVVVHIVAVVVAGMFISN